MGIDIMPGGGFAYALAVDGSIKHSGTVPDAQSLFKVAKRFMPDVIAVDNIRELIEAGLVKKLAKLPAVPRIIQVTKINASEDLKMEQVVKRYLNVDAQSLTPQQTAEYAAILAYRGIGSFVKVFENETKIVVKARISTRQGGQSRNRFERNVAIRIRHIVKDIVEKLKGAGIDFDVFIHKDSEGLRSAVIVAYADKGKVREVVKPVKSLDVKVSLESIVSRSIKYESSESEIEEAPRSSRRLIIGVDPGMVTGLAIMGLGGEVYGLYSGRNVSRRDLLNIVYEYGIPILVATDVSKPPEYVKRLAAMVGAVVYHPDRDLTIVEKSELAMKALEGSGLKVKTPHERDALAAAYKAYLSLQGKLSKVDEVLKELPMQVNGDEVKEMVIRGMSIKDALNKILNRAQQECRQREVIVREVKDCECEGRLTELQNYVRRLEEMLRRVEAERDMLREELERLTIMKHTPSEQSLMAKVKLLEDRVEASERRLTELRGEFDRAMEEFAKAVLGQSYALAASANSREELEAARSRGLIPVINFSEIHNLVTIGRWTGTLIVKDQVGFRAINELYKLGILIVPLQLVLVRELPHGVYIIDAAKLRDFEGRLKAGLSEVDYESLEEIINEYRSFRFREWS